MVEDHFKAYAEQINRLAAKARKQGMTLQEYLKAGGKGYIDDNEDDNIIEFPNK